MENDNLSNVYDWFTTHEEDFSFDEIDIDYLYSYE